MTSRNRSPEERVRFVSWLIAWIGLGGALVIYVVNALQPDASGFELEESKKYLRDMEVFGGTANVLASQVRQWFDSLWHGKSLAVTVAVLSILVALAHDFLAMPLPEVPAGERRGRTPGIGGGDGPT